MNIKEVLDRYKLSSAFYTAYDIGLFDALYESKASTEMLAQKLDVDSSMCKLLLYRLKEAGWICYEDNQWQLGEEFRKEYVGMECYKAQVNHEMNIYNRLMSPEMIVRCLKSGYRHRPFDEKGFSDKEQEIYNKAMNGENIRLIALQLFRMLRGKKKENVIEIGRSHGVILDQLKKLGLKFQSDVVTSDTLSTDYTFDVAIIYNTVHYWDSFELKRQLAQWEKNSSENALIIIIDFFYEEGDEFTANILIDWMTHGGIYWSIIDELNDMMEQSDYVNTKELLLKNIHTNILQYQKMRSVI